MDTIKYLLNQSPTAAVARFMSFNNLETFNGMTRFRIILTVLEMRRDFTNRVYTLSAMNVTTSCVITKSKRLIMISLLNDKDKTNVLLSSCVI